MTDITPLPTPPSTADPVNFATRADTFLGALPDFADEMNAYGGKLNSFSTNSTSSTSLEIGTGSKSLTVTTGKSYVTGMYIRVVSTSTPTNYMQGTVTSYNSGTGALVFNSEIVGGSGTIASWTISMSASPSNIINQGNSSVAVTDTGSNGKVVINTEGTDRVTVDSSGNVGIGTSSPTYKWQITGSSATDVKAYVGNTNTTTGAYAEFEANGQLTNQYCLFGTERVAGPTASHYLWGGGAFPLAFYTNDTERMRITSGGEVYIAGTTDQGAYNLQCNGTGVWGAGAYVNGSDERIKDDIEPIVSGLDVVEKLNPVTYRYKESWTKDQSVQTGFIAQELLTALEGQVYVDGVVQQGGSEGYYSVAYQNLIPILTKAIQEQQAIIEALTARIEALENA
jgi:hypothetical protein